MVYVDWIQLFHGMAQWRALVDTEIKLRSENFIDRLNRYQVLKDSAPLSCSDKLI
jgi:hypothetical protein